LALLESVLLVPLSLSCGNMVALPFVGSTNPSLKFTEWLSQAVYAYQDPTGFAASTLSPVVEDTVKYVSEVLISGYAMTFGFPAYFLASVINSSIGDLDPVRTPRARYPGKVTVMSDDVVWSVGGDRISGVINVMMASAIRERKVSIVQVPGTPIQVRTSSIVTVA
jgi:hypothetical protein